MYFSDHKIIIILICILPFAMHSQIIEEGVYQIYSETHAASLESPIDVNQDDSSNGQINNLFGSPSDINNPFQQFEFIYQGSDIYKIRNIGTNQFVGIKDNWCGNGGDIIARYDETDTNVEFSIVQDAGTGQFSIQIAFTNCNFGTVNSPPRSFDLGNPTAKAKTFGDTGSNQQFRLKSVNPLFASDTYQIFTEVTNEALESPTDVNQDDSGDPSINNLFTTSFDSSNSYQQFEFTYQFTNTLGDVYKIKNIGTNSYVGLKDNFCGNNGEVIAKYNVSDDNVEIAVSQVEATGRYLFRKNDNGNGCSYFDVAGGGSGAKIRTFNATGSNQQFRIKALNPVIEEGIYHLFSEVNGQAVGSPVDVNQDDSSDSTINNLFASDFDASDSYQEFEFSYQFRNQLGDIYKIKNIGTNDYVGLKDNFCGNNGEVIAKYNVSDNNVEIAVSQVEATGRYLFRKNDNGNGCSYFDLAGGGLGAKIRTFNDTGNNQQFRMVELGTKEIYDGSWKPSAPINGNGDDIYLLKDVFATANDLDVNSILVASSGSIEISPSDELTVSASIENYGSFTFKSDANDSGQLAEATGVAINGDVTVERFIPVASAASGGTRAFRFLTSAVNSTDPIYDNWQEGGTSPAGFGTHITGDANGNDGFDATETGNTSMFIFDNNYTNASNAWSPIANTTNTSLEAGKAYRLFIRGDRNYDLTSTGPDNPNTDVILRATGGLVTGDQTFSLNSNQDLYSFVGNPYQAIVNINNVNSTNMNTNFYWVWDPNIGGDNGRGGYVAVELPAGTNAFTNSNANEFVMPGQSFFVQTLNNAAADITFTEASKDVTAMPTSVFSENNLASLNLLLYKTDDLNNDEFESDALQIKFNDQFDNAATIEDADKFINPYENLARVNSGDLLSIESRSLPVDGESLNLYTDGYTANDYTFVITSANLPNDVEVYLVDQFTGNQTLLQDGENQISFTVDSSSPASIATDRFSLEFDIDTFGIDDNEFANDFKVYPNPVVNSQVSIQSSSMSGEAQVSLFNMIGQRVWIGQTSFDNGEASLDLGEQASGVYFLEVNQNGQTLKERLIIK